VVAVPLSETDIARDIAPLLDVRDMHVRFGGIKALDGVSLQLDKGCCGIIGPNGAGKTTLLDALAGIRTPTSGVIRVDGNDVTRRSATWLARHGIRRTFQRHQAFGWLSVEENVQVALEWRGRSRRVLSDLVAAPSTRRRIVEMQERVDEVLERCGLTSVRSRSAATLPIGQVRLLEFARAIIDRPRLLLLDEPTSGLGKSDTDRLAEVIRDVTTNDSCAALLVEHDLDFVVGVCDRLVVLQEGRLLADGEPVAVCREPAVITAYIGAA
jgi:branched-chain amino acid transport system ATP-binding protein